MRTERAAAEEIGAEQGGSGRESLNGSGTITRIAGDAGDPAGSRPAPGIRPRLAAMERLPAISLAGAAIAASFLVAPDTAPALPANFSEVVVFDGLTHPTAVRFSPDGRVFVAEKSGLIKVFDNL